MKTFLSTSNVSEQEIISALTATGNSKRKAEEQLFVKYSYLIANGMHKFSISKDDLFNAYSDAILDTIHAITHGLFEGRSSLKTYLHRIYYNKCIDLLRKKKARKNSVYQTIHIDKVEAFLPDNAMSIVDKIIAKADFSELKQKMDLLSSHHKQLLMLSASGYSDKEITSVMDFKSIDVVKVTRLRCLRKLRCLLTSKEASVSMA